MPLAFLPLYRFSYFSIFISSIFFFIAAIFRERFEKAIFLDSINYLYLILVYFSSINLCVLDSYYELDFTAYLFGILMFSFLYKSNWFKTSLIHIAGVFIFLLLLKIHNVELQFFNAFPNIIFILLGISTNIFLEFSYFERFLLKRDSDLLNLKLKEEAVTDSLTGLKNRQYLEEFLTHETSLFKRNSIPFCVALVDIDNFKKINDDLGHDIGDLVLKYVSNVMKKSMRAIDLVVRYGGEEFIILLTNSDIEGSVTLCEKIRDNIHSSQIPYVPWKISASFGITEIQKTDDQSSLIKRADDYMYEAKKSGKNKCISDIDMYTIT